MTLDRTLLNFIDVLKYHRPGDKIDAELSEHALKTLIKRGYLDMEHKLTQKCFISIQEHLQIQEFLKERTLENLAYNHAYILESLSNGDTSEYNQLSNGVRRKLRMHGLIKIEWGGTGWIPQPLCLWKQVLRKIKLKDCARVQ